MTTHEELATCLSELFSRMYGRQITHDAYRALDGDEGPLLIISSDGFHLVWMERGQESSRQTTTDAQAMVYRILADSAFATAVAHEFEHRVDGQDFRRVVHAKQRALFSELGPEWCARLEAEIEKNLTESPYLDCARN
jgi:hypothetical protein